MVFACIPVAFQTDSVRSQWIDRAYGAINPALCQSGPHTRSGELPLNDPEIESLTQRRVGHYRIDNERLTLTTSSPQPSGAP